MKKLLALFLAVSALVFIGRAMTSCSKDEIIMQNCTTMGTLLGEGRICTDENLIYNIVSGETGAGIEPGTRIMITCDVLRNSQGSTDEFDVRADRIEIPLSGTPGLLSSFDSSTCTDAIGVTDAWLSGGYLNLYCVWIGRRNSSTAHRTELLYDDVREDRDTAAFVLVHDGMGEGFHENTENASDLTPIYKIATFPVQNLIHDGNVAVKLTFTWHVTDGQYIYPQTESRSMIYSLPSSGTGAASSEPSTKAIISPLTTLLP
ncbi:MAG: hypothetical protein ACI3ZC_04650 [Candidatus Cryptobacteroides sp.]